MTYEELENLFVSAAVIGISKTVLAHAPDRFAERIAASAYEIADALMAEKAKREKNDN